MTIIELRAKRSKAWEAAKAFAETHTNSISIWLTRLIRTPAWLVELARVNARLAQSRRVMSTRSTRTSALIAVPAPMPARWAPSLRPNNHLR